MGDRVWPVVLAAVAVTAVLVAVLPDDDDSGPAPCADPVAEFLAAYERSRTSTFVVEQTFTRTAPDGRAITYGRRLAQRPPDDRLLVGGGNAEGRIDGRVVRCATQPDGTADCQEGPPAGPYADEVAGELADLAELVDGPQALYDLTAGPDGCWTLQLRVDYPSPPYGDEAGFCFDAATGAPLRLEVRRPEAVDVVETVELRAEVTAADLQPGDLGDLPGT